MPWFIGPSLSWWSSTLKRAAEEGKIDGEKSIPALRASDISPWERMVVDSWETNLRAEQEDFHTKDAALKTEFQQAKEGYLRAKQAYEERAKKNGYRPVIKKGSVWMGRFVVLIAVLAEIGLNKSIFEITLGDSPVVGIILAVAVSAMLAYWGHSIGIELKHREMPWGDVPIHVFGLIVVGWVLWTFADVRGLILSDLTESPIPRAMLEAGGPNRVSQMFLAMNLFLVFVALMIAFMTTDRDGQYEERIAALRKAEVRIKRVRNARSAVHARHFHRAQIFIENAQQVINQYRVANLRARAEPTPPEVWERIRPEMLIDTAKFPFDLGDNEITTLEPMPEA